MASAHRRVTRFARRALIAGALLAVLVLAAAVTATALPAGSQAAAGVAAEPAIYDDPGPALGSSHPQAVEPEAGVPAGEQSVSTPPSSTTASADGSQSPTDDEIRRELSQLKHLAAGAGLPVGAVGRVLPDGRGVAPQDAPQVVRDVIRAGNVIATTPYLWGGGHGSWSASGYDCSGSVSFALAGAGLLDSPLTSGLLARWGAAGPGRWITIYANGGHVFMEVAGLRFDTGGIRGSGTRWQTTGRSTSGFVARHPDGL